MKNNVLYYTGIRGNRILKVYKNTKNRSGEDEEDSKNGHGRSSRSRGIITNTGICKNG